MNTKAPIERERWHSKPVTATSSQHFLPACVKRLQPTYMAQAALGPPPAQQRSSHREDMWKASLKGERYARQPAQRKQVTQKGGRTICACEEHA